MRLLDITAVVHWRELEKKRMKKLLVAFVNGKDDFRVGIPTSIGHSGIKLAGGASFLTRPANMRVP